MLIELTSVPDTALPVEMFKAHLHMGSGFGQEDAQDEVLHSFLRAALAAIEARTGKALISRIFAWRTGGWASPSAQALPIAPVTQISRMAFVAPDGSETDVSADAYWLERDAHLPRVRPTSACLPSVPARSEALLEFEAGHGAQWDDLPKDMQQAVLMLAAHFYEYRHDTALSDGCMPFGVSSLIERYRTVRLGGRGRGA